MICPACGYENSADDIYCDDCGAQLKQKNEGTEPEYDCGVLPLVAEQIVGERYKVSKIIQSDSDCIIYEVRDLTEDTAEAEGEEQTEKAGRKAGATRPLGGRRYLLCEFPSEPHKAADIYAPFSAVKNEFLWHFDKIINDEKDEPRYLLGPLAGVSLRTYLAEHKFSPEELIALGENILSALTAVHSLGYVYNGVSLDSVWINSDNKACLVRFDRAVQAYSAPLQATVIHGYSAPEAYGLEGGMLTRKSDIYSVGALLYYLLVGREISLEEPAANSFPATLRLKAKSLTKVIAKALKRNPDERWLSASEMSDALSKCTLSGGAAAEAAPPVVSEYAKTVATSLGRYSIAKKSHVGAVRKINQDAFLELSLSACERDIPTSLHFIGIIDGMGGEAEGDKAASLAVRAIAEELVRLTLPLRNERATTVLLPIDPEERNSAIIERVVKKANQTIFEYACKSPARKGMGCTISCVLLDGDNATFGHVGDTRGYRFGRELDQVTTDHSVVGQLVQMGLLTREEARHSPKRSIIYRALGTQPDIEVEVYKRTIAPGEYIMLCCDGIWEYYSDEEMFSFFNANLAPAEICEQLVSACLERGANDNTTVAVIRHL